MDNRKTAITREEAEQVIRDGFPRGNMWEACIACITCKHWMRGDGEWGGNYALAGVDTQIKSYGVCTLNPEWVIAPATHFCAKHDGSTKRTLSSVIYSEQRIEERTKRLALEKQNKALRADLRAAKSERKP